jgi:hypothetical protein
MPQPPLSNALLEAAREQQRRIGQRLREVLAQIAGLQGQIGPLLADKAQLLQQRRRAETLVAFASAPKLLRQDRCCPVCYIQHDNRIPLTAVPGSKPLGQYLCPACGAVYVLEPERALETQHPPAAAAASVRLYLPDSKTNTNKERHPCV